MKIISKEIKENYAQKYGYTAEDIFNKILVDNSTFSIFQKLFPKLNIHEKTKLLNLLVENEIDNYDSRDGGVHYHYIRNLRSEIDVQVINEYCKRLLREVEKGEKHHIYALFEIFGTNLNNLAEDERNTILLYIYNRVNSITLWNDEIKKNRILTLFSTLGLYMENPDIKEKFFDLLIKVVKNHALSKSDKWYYMSAYERMVSKFTDQEKEKCIKYIKDILGQQMADSFVMALEEDDLPF